MNDKAGVKVTVNPLIAVIVTLSYYLLLEKLGAITISSPIAHPEVLPTVIEVSPALAIMVRGVCVVAGLVP